MMAYKGSFTDKIPFYGRLGSTTIGSRRFANPSSRLRFSLGLIRSLIERGKRKGRIRQLADRIISGVAEGDFAAELAAVAEWVKGAVRYTRDPWNLEKVSDALDTIKRGAGDCDDLTVLVGSLLESIGFETRLKVVGKEFPSHIFPEARVGDEWVPVDCARKPENVFEKKNTALL